MVQGSRRGAPELLVGGGRDHGKGDRGFDVLTTDEEGHGVE